MAAIASPPSTSRLVVFSIAAGLALITLAVYWRAGSLEFVNYDDPLYVTENSHVQEGLTAESVRWAFTSLEVWNWHPLTWLSFQLDRQLFGNQATGFHWTNVLLHVANVLILFGFMRRLTGTLWPSALIAALFSVHPLHVESVAWISERKDVLSGCFGLLALWAYLRYAERPGWLWYGIVFLCLMLGLMAKSMIVTLPFVMLLLDFWPLRRWFRSDTQPSFAWLVLEKLPFLVLSGAFSYLTLLAHHQGGALRFFEKNPLSERIGMALQGYAGYLSRLIWPVNLAIHYPNSHLPWWDGRVLAAVLLVLAISAGCLILGKQRPYFIVGWFWFIGMLVPVSGLIPIGERALADRYAYLPMIGIYLILALAGAEAVARQPRSVSAAWLGAGALLVMLMLASWRQLGFWRDSASLWEHAVQAAAPSALAYTSFGKALADQGKKQEALKELDLAVETDPHDELARYNRGALLMQLARWQEAQRDLELLLTINPQNPAAHLNLGVVLSQQRRGPEAAGHYRMALQLDPTLALGHLHLAEELLKQHDLEAAREHLLQFLSAKPAFGETYHLIGVSYLFQANYAEALRWLDKSMQLNSKNAQVHADRAMALGLQGNWFQALEACREAAGLAPGTITFRRNLALALHETGDKRAARMEFDATLRQDARWPEILRRRAWTLATAAEARERNGVESLWLALLASRADSGRPDYLDTLAAAYAEAGRYKEAAATAREALQAVSASQPERSTAIRQRLALYEKHLPFRDRGPKSHQS
jgi:tetratricopeptide (TPR) repeat protein